MEYTSLKPAATFAGKLGLWEVYEVAPGITAVIDPLPLTAEHPEPQTDCKNMREALAYIRKVEAEHARHD